MMKTVLRLLITLLVFALILRSVNLSNLADTLKQIEAGPLVLAVLLQFASTVLAALRWRLVMQRLEFGQDTWFYVKSYFKGMFFNQGLPTSIGGDAIRVLDVARQGFRKRESFYGVASDRIIGLAALLLLNLLASLALPHTLPKQVFVPIALLVGAGLIGFGALFFFRRLHWFSRWPVMNLLPILSERMHRIFHAPGASVVIVLLSLVIHLLAVLSIYCIGLSVDLPYGPLTYLVIVPPVILLTIVPVSLAGWGVREGGMVGLFALIGAAKAAVLTMSIVYGLILILVSLPGLVVYLTGKHHL
ncbi:MAG: lysylphosphatidylglycerol synthase transmembrane domain-containing protein [Gammaproteobacteria bacterium]|jgi:uncharacterized membrane protein YbhN (UPF0104 family)